MAGEVDIEGQFEEAFTSLLRKCLKKFSGYLVLFLPSDFDEWEETKVTADLAARAPALHASVPGGTAAVEERITGWLRDTMIAALRPYRELRSSFPLVSALGGGEQVGQRGPRLRRITHEVLIWAKATSIPYLATARLSGIAPAFGRPAKVEEDVFLRKCKGSGLLAFLSSTGVCIEMRDNVARGSQPTKELPQRFLTCLRLVTNQRLDLSNIEVRPAIPVFDRQSGLASAPPLFTYPTVGSSSVHQLSTADVRRARSLVEAFSNLHESGFDLALDLYVRHLQRDDKRERAVDIAIALENLFLRGKDGLTYRFSLHIAMFGRRLAATKRVSRSMAKKLYSARSDVVHGNKPSNENIELLNLTGAGLVRATLIAIASKRNRVFLQNIDVEVEKLISP